MTSFVNSLSIACLSSLFSLILGLPLAVLIAKTNLPFKKYINLFYLIPIFIPPSLIAVTWITIFGGCRCLYSITASSFILAFSYFPFVTLLSIVGLMAVGQDLEEAARLALSETEVLTRVSIPYAGSHIISGVIFVFILAISNYEVPSLLGVKTLPVEIFAQFSSFYNTKQAILLTIPLVAITTILVMIMGRLMSGRDYIAISQNWFESREMKLSKTGKTNGTFYAIALLAITTLFPIAVFLKQAGGFGTYIKALKLSFNELLYSFVIAIVGTTLVLLLSFIVSYILSRKKGGLRNMLYYASILPFGIPATACGIILIKLFNRPSLNFFYSSPLILLIGYAIRFSPFAIRILESSIAHIDKCYDDEAEVEGIKIFKKLLFILAPLSLPGLVISWVVVFALIMGELGLTIMVIPPGFSTLTLKIYTLMHYGSGRLVAGLSVIIIALIVIVAALVAFGNKVIKKALLFILIFLILTEPFKNIAYAQNKDEHVYSTWNVVELDTCASAWLIKRFIDKEARFEFYPKGAFIEKGVPFDTPDAEFRRTHNMSTFETILKKYNLQDPKLIKLGEMIHSIEINYWDANGVSMAKKINSDTLSIIKNSKNTQEALTESFSYFDELYPLL